MQELIIGAAISIFTLIVTSIIQWLRDLQAREWHINDQQIEQAQQTISQRIEQLELFAKELVMAIGQVAMEMAEAVRPGPTSDHIASLREKYTELAALNAQIFYYAGISTYLGKEVNDAFSELSKKYRYVLFQVFTSWISKLNSDIDPDPDDSEAFEKALDTKDTLANLLRALDSLKHNPQTIVAGNKFIQN